LSSHRRREKVEYWFDAIPSLLKVSDLKGDDPAAVAAWLRTKKYKALSSLYALTYHHGKLLF
jgi:hypothetical protein